MSARERGARSRQDSHDPKRALVPQTSKRLYLAIAAPPKIVEERTLWNAWIKSVNFSNQLSYGGDAIVDVTMGITYDWAEYTTSADGSVVYDGTGGLQKLSS